MRSYPCGHWWNEASHPSRVWIVLLVLLVWGCGRQEPLKVGFVGGLTGRLSDLGTAGRDGVLLAVEEVNRAGGIHGRTITLLVKDDKHSPDEAKRVDQELIDEGVVAIIGHMTSAMTVAVLPLINEKHVLMIAPTVSSDQVSGIDDYFLRVTAPSTQEAVRLAQVAYNSKGSRKIVAVFDDSNRSYSLRFVEVFGREFERLGGNIVKAEAFASGQDWRPVDIAQMVVAAKPDGVLMVAGAGDAAMFCQQLHKLGCHASVYLAGWAMTDEFLRTGGPAVEGVVFNHVFDQNNQSPTYLKFKQEFLHRFGREPDFAATYSFQAARVLLEALAKVDVPEPQKLKDAIIKQETFQGVQGDFTIDRFGDAQCKRFNVTVSEGRFVTTE
ncbi:MAG TPA: amino acid ABC transporter substrate-binding protein [Syntrophobacteraceae bacterium]|nr:amino acid ABC transporter substrate-binding protein [Syntrophobacteraceae bacterium]